MVINILLTGKLCNELYSPLLCYSLEKRYMFAECLIPYAVRYNKTVTDLIFG